MKPPARPRVAERPTHEPPPVCLDHGAIVPCPHCSMDGHLAVIAIAGAAIWLLAVFCATVPQDPTRSPPPASMAINPATGEPWAIIDAGILRGAR